MLTTAVLESGAFGEYQPLTLQEGLRQPDNINPLEKGEVVHHERALQSASGDAIYSFVILMIAYALPHP